MKIISSYLLLLSLFLPICTTPDAPKEGLASPKEAVAPPMKALSHSKQAVATPNAKMRLLRHLFTNYPKDFQLGEIPLADGKAKQTVSMEMSFNQIVDMD